MEFVLLNFPLEKEKNKTKNKMVKQTTHPKLSGLHLNGHNLGIRPHTQE